MDNKDKVEQTQTAGAAKGGNTSFGGLTRYDGFCSYDGGGPAEMEVSKDGEYVKFSDVAALASQSQAAQPTTTAPLKLYAFTEDGMEIDNAHGHWYKKDDVERLFAAHIAGTSQAAKAQAEPEGWQLVPKKLTPKMTEILEFGRKQPTHNTYLNLLAVAPQAPVAKEAPAVPELTVWYGPMSESNGAQNFTATLMRKGASVFDTDSYAFSRSEYPDRVRYEADSMRYLIGELAEKPCILDYDADKHSSYVEPTASVAKEATLDDVAPGIPTASQVQAVEAQLYRDLTGDAMGLGFDGVPAALEAVRKANVMPPFAAPAGQHEAIVGAVARGLGAPDCRYDELDKKVVDAIVREVEDALASGFREGRNAQTKSTDSSDVATTTSTVSAPPVAQVVAGKLANRLEWIGDEAMVATRVGTQLYTDGAQKAPEDARNQALTDAATACREHASGTNGIYRQASLNCADAIDALRTSSTDQANADTGSAE